MLLIGSGCKDHRRCLIHYHRNSILLNGLLLWANIKELQFNGATCENLILKGGRDLWKA